ncbi:Non-heme dioxygenase N-terminal domain-containing protein [Heracleum sosnowskyi]|uniref:Non-heme dioxygenase N-terminal domain-containing protein n=1 Tax=Heracleum sosnowskyi TaxID=360622 RepID=A0AAD8N444_9APIA|nr:Non-heme dioxygenase N-terminal domain-containing protein [Heracleum sosnowskyi]
MCGADQSTNTITDVLDKNASLVNSVREEELKAFDDTKLGVKGLVDAGMVNIPGIFVRPPDELSRELLYSRTHLQVPRAGGKNRCDLLQIVSNDYMEKFFSKRLDGQELRDLFKL